MVKGKPNLSEFMTTFVLAPDSFKESMTAQQACAAMQRGIRAEY